MRTRHLLFISFVAVFLAISLSSANASYIVTFTGQDPVADKAKFLGMLNNSSTGGTWTLDMMNQLSFTADGNPLNNFVARLDYYNNYLSNNNLTRTVDVRQNYPGVLVGAFGPKFNPVQPDGTQLLDLGDIEKFSQTVVQQPLLDLRSSVLLHELSELFMDGGAGNFQTAHTFGGIIEQNSELTSRGSKGLRRLLLDLWNVNNATGIWQLRTPWRNTETGVNGFEVLTGSGAYNLTNIASGLADTGTYYDGSGYDIVLETVHFEAVAVPEPGSFLLLGSGLAGLVAWRKRSGKRG